MLELFKKLETKAKDFSEDDKALCHSLLVALANHISNGGIYTKAYKKLLDTVKKEDTKE